MKQSTGERLGPGGEEYETAAMRHPRIDCSFETESLEIRRSVELKSADEATFCVQRTAAQCAMRDQEEPSTWNEKRFRS
jgi:hypothetical protein